MKETLNISQFLEDSIPRFKATYLLSYAMKLTVCHLVKKFPAFYGTRRFITAFTSASHLSLS
jgi:hypothetical protein